MSKFRRTVVGIRVDRGVEDKDGGLAFDLHFDLESDVPSGNSAT